MKLQKTKFFNLFIVKLSYSLFGVFLLSKLVFKNYIIFPISFIFFYLIYLVFKKNLNQTYWVFNTINLFFLIIRVDPLFSSSQSVYFPKILAQFDYGNVENFWISQISSPYPFFYEVLTFFIKYFGLSSINLLLYVINGLFIISIFKISNTFFKSHINQKSTIVAVAFIILLAIDSSPSQWVNSESSFKSSVSNLIGLTNLLLDGVSGFSEFNSRRSLIPASFDILILISVYLITKGKYIKALIWGLFISIFHYFSFIYVFLIFLSLLIAKLNKKNTKPNLLYLALCFVSPFITNLIINLFNLIDSDLKIQNSLDILYKRGSPEWILEPVLTFGSIFGANIKNSFLYLLFDLRNFRFVKNFSNLDYISPTNGSFDGYSVFPVEFLFLVTIGFVISKKLNSEIYANMIFVTTLVTINAWYFQSTLKLGSAAILHAYRVSGISTLLSTLMILIYILRHLNPNLTKLISIFILSLMFISPLTNSFYNDEVEDKEFIEKHLQEFTIKDSKVVMIPHDKTTWILNSGGLNVYSSKLFPYSFDFANEWQRRYENQKKIYNTTSCLALESLLNELSIDTNLIVATYDDKISSLSKNCSIRIVIYDN